MLFWRIRSRCEMTSWGSVYGQIAILCTIPENKRRQVRDPQLLVEEYSQVVSYLLYDIQNSKGISEKRAWVGANRTC